MDEHNPFHYGQKDEAEPVEEAAAPTPEPVTSTGDQGDDQVSQGDGQDGDEG